MTFRNILAMPDDPKTPLDQRLDEVEALRNLNDRSWSLKAGLSEGYLATQRLRASQEPAFLLPEKNGTKLARVAAVNPEWLRKGVGTREGNDPVEDAPTSPRGDLVAFLGQSVGKLHAAGDVAGARAAVAALAQLLGMPVAVPTEVDLGADPEADSGQRRKVAVGDHDDAPTTQRTRKPSPPKR